MPNPAGGHGWISLWKLIRWTLFWVHGMTLVRTLAFPSTLPALFISLGTTPTEKNSKKGIPTGCQKKWFVKKPPMTKVLEFSMTLKAEDLGSDVSLFEARGRGICLFFQVAI